MIETFLFLFFVSIMTLGLFLILKKSGSHDIDFITNILGWILIIPSILGILQSLKILWILKLNFV